MRSWCGLVFSMKQFPSVSALMAASSIPSTLQASLLFPVAHSFTLLNDTFDWSTDAMLKLKDGVVMAEQHQEGRVQDSQSMLDRQCAKAP